MIDVRRQEEAFEKFNCGRFYKNVCFKDIIYLNKEKYNSEKEKIEYKCIELENIESNTGKINGFSSSLESKSIKNVFDNECILYGKLRPYLNKYSLPNFNGVCSSEILVFKAKNDCPREYPYYVLQSNGFNQVVENTSGTKMPRLSSNDILNYSFNFHNNKFTTKITNLLTGIDDLIRKQEEYIEMLKIQKKGYSQKLFNQQLRFKGFEEDLKVEELGEYTQIIKGLTGVSKRDFEAKDYNAKYIQFKNIHNSKINKEELGTIKLLNIENQNKIHKNDILVTTSSENIDEVGTTNINRLEMDNLFLNSFSFGIRPNGIDANYLHYHLKDEKMRRKIILKGQGITRINLSPNNFSKLKINIVELEEESKIGNLLFAIDEKIELHEKKLEQLKLKKKHYLNTIF